MRWSQRAEQTAQGVGGVVLVPFLTSQRPDPIIKWSSTHFLKSVAGLKKKKKVKDGTFLLSGDFTDRTGTHITVTKHQ